MTKVALAVFIVGALAGRVMADVVITADERGESDTATRDRDLAVVKHALAAKLPIGVAPCRIDMSIARLDIDQSDTKKITFAAELRIAVSDEHGRILSVMSGGARLESTGTLDDRHLARMRDDVLAAATEGMAKKVRTQLVMVPPRGGVQGLATRLLVWIASPGTLPTS